MSAGDPDFKALAVASARSLNQWALLSVVAIVVAGLIIVGLGPWRAGSAVVGAGLLVGAIERLVLPPRWVGLLEVRTRMFDVVLLSGFGLGILLLAFLVPEGPTG